MTEHCYLPLSDHSAQPSDEHIFPASIGGILQSRGLLCQKHNNELGHTIDAVLSQAFLPYCVLLGLRGRNDDAKKSFQMEMAGRKVNVFSNGRATLADPKFERAIDPTTGKQLIKIEAPDEDYLRLLLEQFKKKRPDLNMQEAQIESYSVSLEPDGKPSRIEIPFFDQSIHRSLCKTIANLWMLRRAESEPIDPLIRFILNKDSLPIAPYHGPDVLADKPDHGILNSVVIMGSQGNRKLIGYVEILDAFRYIVLIQANYTGPDLCLHLSENVMSDTSDAPVDGVRINTAPLLAFSNYEIDSDQLNLEAIKKAFSRLAFAIEQKAEFNRIFNLAMDSAMEEYERSEDLSRFIAVMAEKLAFGLTERFRPRDTE